MKIRAIAASMFLMGCMASANAVEPPISSDPAVNVTLFAAEPQIVTPIGAAIDARGRLLVVESHSHFRPKNYQGPATDRIRILEDTDGDGHADRFTTFYEGTNLIMNLAPDKDGSVVVSSRNEIFRITADGKRLTLAKLETKSDYPHNGLAGLTIDGERHICFGIGENLGGLWKLVGTDGRTLSDNTGTGTVFRMDGEGKGLVRLAKGFWNPFGMGADPAGNVWLVDNDPDGRPPCRLIHVVPGGDYGYEYRYGRTGMHPLQCWDAELPGTLGMVSGVGEGPCAVHWWNGHLLVSSWRDHQVESFTLSPRGASYSATMKVLVSGGQDFRPVGIATAADGSIYVTDWGSDSYTINHKGRVWKLTFTQEQAPAPAMKPTSAMEKAAGLRQSRSIPELLAALDDADPVMAQAAEYGLSQLPQIESMQWSMLKSPHQKIGFLAAILIRGSNADRYIQGALADEDDRVRQMGVRSVTEQQITSARGDLERLLESQLLSPRLLGMTVAAIAQLDGDPAAKIDASRINKVLLGRLGSAQATDESRVTTLHMLQASHPHISFEQLTPLLQSQSHALELEAVRYLGSDTDAARFPLLATVAVDAKVNSQIRAEAVLALSDDAAEQSGLLMQLAGSDDAAIRGEALRSLRAISPKLSNAQKEQLGTIAARYPADAPLVDRLVGKSSPRPPETDIAAWQKVLEAAPGDAVAGERIFFHPSGPACYRCHMIEGRGRSIGPDLTMIGHSRSPQHILESILDPSREIAPLYTLWSIKTKLHQQIDAMLLRRDGQSMEVYVDSTGIETKVPENTIIDRRIRKESLMPTGLVQALTDQELRDLVAFLSQKR